MSDSGHKHPQPVPGTQEGKGDRGHGEDAGGSGAGYRLLCSRLMFDLEQRAKCASLLRNTPICQTERTPASGQPGWARELCGEKHLIRGRQWGCCYCCSPALAVCHCLQASVEKGLLSFSVALDWLGRQHNVSVMRAGEEDPYNYENQAICQLGMGPA